MGVTLPQAPLAYRQACLPWGAFTAYSATLNTSQLTWTLSMGSALIWTRVRSLQADLAQPEGRAGSCGSILTHSVPSGKSLSLAGFQLLS